MMFISVDLPDPDAPMIATKSPRSTVSETPRRACTSIVADRVGLDDLRAAMTDRAPVPGARSGLTGAPRAEAAAAEAAAATGRSRPPPNRRSSSSPWRPTTDTVGSTTTSPTLTPGQDLGRRGADEAGGHGRDVCLPLASSGDGRERPVVVIAALGSSSTFALVRDDDADVGGHAVADGRRRVDQRDRHVVGDDVARTVDVGDTAVTLPVTVGAGERGERHVRRLADLDLRRVGLGEAGDDLELPQVLDVTTPDDELGRRRLDALAPPPWPAPPATLDAELLLALAAADELLPTVSPTLALTAVTVPLIGACRTVSRERLLRRWRRRCGPVATCASSCATVGRVDGESTARLRGGDRLLLLLDRQLLLCDGLLGVRDRRVGRSCTTRSPS